MIGLVNLVCSFVFVTCFNTAAESQVLRIRKIFLKSILRQDIAWYADDADRKKYYHCDRMWNYYRYDVTQTGDFASRISDDLAKIQVAADNLVARFSFY